jgi:hypothetical protein
MIVRSSEDHQDEKNVDKRKTDTNNFRKMEEKLVLGVSTTVQLLLLLVIANNFQLICIQLPTRETVYLNK